MTENSAYEISQSKRSRAVEARMYEVPVNESESLPTESTYDYGIQGPYKEMVNITIGGLYMYNCYNNFYWAQE